MKAIATLLTICFMGCLATCHRQEKKETTGSPQQQEKSMVNSSKQMNLMDEQTKIFGQMFVMGAAGEDNPIGGARKSSELLDKNDCPEERQRNGQGAVQDL